MYKHQFYC